MIKRDKLRKAKIGEFDSSKIRKSLYRPYTRKLIYLDYIPIDVVAQQKEIFPTSKTDNKMICFASNQQTDIVILSSNTVVDLNVCARGGSCFPLYRYDTAGNRIDNITDWGLKQFTENYSDDKIKKEDIFYYVYAVLHNPKYREKYELNLKREFPRMPFYNNFHTWVDWGKELMNLHINFDTVKPYNLKITESENIQKEPVSKLKIDKINKHVILDENITIKSIPKEIFEYKLGNRSAIEWILNQYKEKNYTKNTLAKYSDKQILNKKFNTYKFADYKEQIIDLIKRISTVSIKTIEIINKMKIETTK